MNDHHDDRALRDSLLAEVPARGAGYWDRFDRLVDQEQAVGPTANPDSFSNEGSLPSDDITATDELAARRRLRWGRPLALVAASLIIVAALVGSQLARSNDTSVETGFASDPRIIELEKSPGPTMNKDHWNAAYGVWDCTADEGAGAWVEPFQSNDDDVGIHSHRDGLISIHPFFEESAGRNATFGLFADSMNIEVTDTSITLDDGRILAAGAICDGEPAVVQMHRWSSAPDLEADPTIPPIIITEAFDEQRFYNDLEVWTLALAPLNGDALLPPRERFDRLAQWWFTGDVTAASVPPATEMPQQFSLPDVDGRSGLRLLATGADADEAIAEILSTSQNPPLRGEVVLGSGNQWEAVSPQARQLVHLFTFDVLDGAAEDERLLTCEVTWVPELETISNGLCVPSDETTVGVTRVSADSFGESESMVLWDAPSGASSIVVTTVTNRGFSANIVDGVSYLAWPMMWGKAQRVDILDADLNVLWTQDQD